MEAEPGRRAGSYRRLDSGRSVWRAVVPLDCVRVGAVDRHPGTVRSGAASHDPRRIAPGGGVGGGTRPDCAH